MGVGRFPSAGAYYPYPAATLPSWQASGSRAAGGYGWPPYYLSQGYFGYPGWGGWWTHPALQYTQGYYQAYPGWWPTAPYGPGAAGRSW